MGRSMWNRWTDGPLMELSAKCNSALTSGPLPYDIPGWMMKHKQDTTSVLEIHDRHSKFRHGGLWGVSGASNGCLELGVCTSMILLTGTTVCTKSKFTILTSSCQEASYGKVVVRLFPKVKRPLRWILKRSDESVGTRARFSLPICRCVVEVKIVNVVRGTVVN